MSITFKLKETIADGEERKLIVVGDMKGHLVAIVNTYAPTIDSPEYYDWIKSQLAKLPRAVIIWGADFNAVMDSSADRSLIPTKDLPQSTKKIKQICELHKLVDVWRLRHPLDREFIFYSHPHGTATCIDHLFLTD